MIKNYTSGVSVQRSIAFIENKLAANGARQILKLYDDSQRVTGICFMIQVNGKEMPFKLPARIQECENILRANLSSRARPETINKIGEQAERTAWKIVSDWVEAQMAMIELAQVEIMEVFLPYLYNHSQGQTYFEILKGNNYKALPPGITRKDSE